MEIIGTKGEIYIDRSGFHYSVIDEKGIRHPDSTYLAKVHGSKTGYLKEEFDYFLKCIANGKKPTVITPQESGDVVYAIKMAEESAIENKVVEF